MSRPGRSKRRRPTPSSSRSSAPAAARSLPTCRRRSSARRRKPTDQKPTDRTKRKDETTKTKATMDQRHLEPAAALLGRLLLSAIFLHEAFAKLTGYAGAL